MTEMNLVLYLSLVTFALTALWMYQSKREAEEGLNKKQPVRVTRQEKYRRN
jgi:uncharacterized membrane protein